MKPIIGMTTVLKGGDHSDKHARKQQMALNLAYIDAVRLAGGLPVALPHCDRPDEIEQLLDMIDGIILTGGRDILPSRLGQPKHPKARLMEPRRDAAEFAILERAQTRKMPIFGICLGCQIINVARGGSIHQHLYDAPRSEPLPHNDQLDDYTHPVTIQPDSGLARITGRTRIDVNSRHHQALDAVGRGLRVNARSPDGLVEAVDDPDYPFMVAVQWHPEDMTDRPEHLNLFKALVAAADE